MSLRRRWVVVCALSLAACFNAESPAQVRQPTDERSRVAERAEPTSAPQPSPDSAPTAEGSAPSGEAAPTPAQEQAPESQLAPAFAPPAHDDVGALSGRPSKGAARKQQAGAIGLGSLGVIGRGAGGGGSGYGYGTGAIAQQESREGYAHVADADFIGVDDQPLSTFSVDVDTASYSNVRRFLREGRLPPADAVRVEELINYFDYDYPAPTGKEPFSVRAEVSDCPWSSSHRLVHIGVQGRELDQAQTPARNLVFLLDVSGSMKSPDKLPLLKRGMAMLTRNLRAQDRLSIVVYAGASGLVLPTTRGSEQGKILDALERLEAGGSTNGAAGIELAYRQASAAFVPGGINRVILATDGDFNVGITSEGELTRLIEEKRKSGVFLTVLGFGTGNLQDAQMEKLADKGNGNYAYIDSDAEARKVLVREAGSTLVTIAKDVKLQVEWNPEHVKSYRLIGYENRTLAARDFNDDKKDAGEIGAGHSVTALYEIVPAGTDEAERPAVDPLRYQGARRAGADPSLSRELFSVKVRYKAPGSDTSELVRFAVDDHQLALSSTSEAFRFSAAVAGFGMLLRDSPHKGDARLSALSELARSALGDDPHGDKRELLELMRAAKRLGLGG